MSDEQEINPDGRLIRWKPARNRRSKKSASTRKGTPDPSCDKRFPIVFLGQRGGVYYFLSPSGELRTLGFQQLTPKGIMSLFEGDPAWLKHKFPAMDQDGEIRGVHFSRAGDWLMQESQRAGLYNPMTPIRGPGVWPDTEANLIVHCGDRLISVIDRIQKSETAGCIRDGVIYAAAPKLPPPASEPATIEEVQQIRAALASWRYEFADIGPDIVLGWIASAMLGGAADWRIHMMIKGPRGIGKTGLTTFVTNVLGASAQPAFNDFSEAGLRQALTGEARAIMLDESESEERGVSRVAAVITLIRRMSSGDGARSLRGSSGHVAHSFNVTGSAWLSAILQPPLKPQDRSRIIELFLEPLPRGKEGAAGAEGVKDRYALARELSPRLRARAILGWERHRTTLAMYRRAFLDAGLDVRESDKVAAILAGRDLMLADVLPDADSVEEDVERFAPLVVAAKADEDEGEGQECLTHLLSSPMDVYRGGERRTIGQVLMAASGYPEDDLQPNPARRVLEGVGVKLILTDAGNFLKVANQHVGLTRIFDGTRWAEGKWRDALHYLPGAIPGGREQFAGAQSRCTQLPEAYLPSKPVVETAAGDPRQSLG